ncbi:integral membrane protein DUF6 [Protomyces lactucae-debilis]|uniref:Integral membrane protein DUF6 n=1 Tax=Protomyces lactucae-debilis TaxID=2754530 RepID=A0A1Y2FEN6_PROLT|nr:integral membrane protein DUF6 [Protomyces lactucae-debilis]ORY81874.1 integral membrane protein DUF6 [Protomyces lactucae-debilis]
MQARIESVRDFVKRNQGLLLIALSQFFFSSMNVWAKLLTDVKPPAVPVSTFQLIFVRMSLTYVCAVIYMVTQKVDDWFLGPKEVRGLLVLRSCVGFLGLFSIYFSLRYLPLSDATVLTFLVPCCTLVMGFFFLGEGFSKKEAVAGLIALGGVVFIARPVDLFGGSSHDVEGETTNAQRLTAVGVSLLGVLGASAAYVTIRRIGKRAHALISVSMFSLCSCLISLIGLIVTRQAVVVPKGKGMLYLLLMGLAGFVAQFLLTMGLQREKAGRGSSALYLQLLFAVVWEKVIFDTTPDIWSGIGILLILASTLYVALSTQAKVVVPESSPEEQVLRRDSSSSSQGTIVSSEGELAEGRRREEAI